MAGAAAMSRATFALRFKEAAGVPPPTYLLNWPMRWAACEVRQEDTPVAAIAQHVGYTSEGVRDRARQAGGG
ncbi:hypothetical protein AB0N36_38090 [Streptomyces acidicola]